MVTDYNIIGNLIKNEFWTDSHLKRMQNSPIKGQNWGKENAISDLLIFCNENLKILFNCFLFLKSQKLQ